MDDLINTMFSSVQDTLNQFVYSDLMVVFIAVLSIILIILGSHFIKDALRRAMLAGYEDAESNRRKEESEDYD